MIKLSSDSFFWPPTYLKSISTFLLTPSPRRLVKLSTDSLFWLSSCLKSSYFNFLLAPFSMRRGKTNCRLPFLTEIMLWISSSFLPTLFSRKRGKVECWLPFMIANMPWICSNLFYQLVFQGGVVKLSADFLFPRLTIFLPLITP